MKLVDLSPTHKSFIYMERYLNDGSPSGFSFLNTPGTGFRPSDSNDSFDLPIFDCSHAEAAYVGGKPTLAVGELPVHPEMEKEFFAIVGCAPCRYYPATVTSSGRTLSVDTGFDTFYAKVAYQRLLGRVTRCMTKGHVLSAVEVSSVYESAIRAGVMPSSFNIYREHSGLFFPEDSHLKNWGYVERELIPFPAGASIEVPAFSLFAKSQDGGPSLLEQLFDENLILKTSDGFFEYFIKPLVDAYFYSVVHLGLQPEVHAQNVVFLLDSSYMPIGIALRDMESVDKDVPLLEKLGMSNCFTKTGYKFLEEQAYNYRIMHSFMYDFKLGKYLLEPLIGTWSCSAQDGSNSEIEKLTKKYARSWLDKLPTEYFPDGIWFDYDAVVHEGASERSYRRNPNPRFR